MRPSESDQNQKFRINFSLTNSKKKKIQELGKTITWISEIEPLLIDHLVLFRTRTNRTRVDLHWKGSDGSACCRAIRNFGEQKDSKKRFFLFEIVFCFDFAVFSHFLENEIPFVLRKFRRVFSKTTPLSGGPIRETRRFKWEGGNPLKLVVLMEPHLSLRCVLEATRATKCQRIF